MKDIIKWFENYNHETQAGELPDMRRLLAIENYKLGKSICKLEISHKRTYAERKIAEETEPLKYEGTVQERTGQAMNVIKPLRLKEADIEGRLRGYKIMYDSASKIMDAMSSYIRLMQ